MKLPVGYEAWFAFFERVGLMLVVFGVPLFFLPWSLDAIEASKQLLLMAGVAVMVIGHRGGQFMQKRLMFKFGWFDLVALLLLVASILSALFSVGSFTSWLGLSTQESQSVLTLLLLLVFYFEGRYVLTRARAGEHVIQGLLVMGGLSSVFFWGMFFLRQLTDISNPVGTIFSFIIVQVTIMILACGYHLASSDKTNTPGGVLVKAASIITSVSTIVLLLMVDAWWLWILVFAGFAGVLLAGVLKASKLLTSFQQVALQIALAASLLFVFVPSPFTNPFTAEVLPNWGTSQSVAIGALQGESYLFGTGPGTYLYAFSRYQPSSIHETAFWDVRFHQGGNHVWTYVTTHGLLGVSAFVLFILGVIILARKQANQYRSKGAYEYVLFPAWFVLLLSSLLYPWNMVLWTLFIVCSTLLVSKYQSSYREWVLSTARNTKHAFFLHTLTFFISLLLLVGILVISQKVISEGYFARAVELHEAGEPVDTVIAQIEKATRLNTRNDLFYRNLGQALLVHIGEITNDPALGDANIDDQARLLQALVAASIDSAKIATDVAPYNVLNWRVRGAIYRESIPFIDGADDFAVLSYKRAILIEPLNPINHVGLARVYLTMAKAQEAFVVSANEEEAQLAARQVSGYLGKAQEAIEEALLLRPQYTPALFYGALVQERLGRYREAQTLLEEVRKEHPLDAHIAFSLGVIALQLDEPLIARQEFERAVSLVPTYADARWLLASLYESLGDTEAARRELEIIARFNPDEPRVQARLDVLDTATFSDFEQIEAPSLSE